MMKSYTTAFPFFPSEEIEEILGKIKMILNGEDMLSMGKYVSEFEDKFAKYCGVKYSVATNSCTSALKIAFKSLNLDKDDEVIIPAQTFFANLSSVVNAGAKPIICDTGDNFLLDFKSLKKLVTQKTKAVVVVHFAGLISKDIFKIKKFLKQRNITLIEDCAHSHGAIAVDKAGKAFKAGSIGDIGCFSFFSTKIMTTGEGGAITCNDKKIADFCKSFRNRGIDCNKQGENFKYYGENFRFTDIAALLGLSQLKKLDSFLKHRNKIAKLYKKELAPLEEQGILSFQKVSLGYKHSYWRFIVFLHKHNPLDIIQKLRESGVNADAPYNPLIHKQPIISKKINLKNVDNISKKHISLPIHLKIKKEDAKKISKIVKELLNEK